MGVKTVAKSIFKTSILITLFQTNLLNLCACVICQCVNKRERGSTPSHAAWANKTVLILRSV